MSRKKSKWDMDLTGKQFGDWKVIERSSKIYYWVCECKCGLIRDVWYTNLINGITTKCASCGSKDSKIIKESKKELREKNIGKTIGRLTILEVDETKKRPYYICRCECGNICSVDWYSIKYGKTLSCGCIKKEKGKKEKDKLTSYLPEIHGKYYKEGTSLSSFNQKLSKNSTTGIKGVSRMKNGKYRAYINIKRKHIHLGTFDTEEEALSAREEGEKLFHQPILEKYEGELE